MSATEPPTHYVSPMLPLLLLLLPLVVPLLLLFLVKSMSFKSIGGALYSRIGDVYYYLSDGELNYGKTNIVLRHSRPFVLYRGTKTNAIISVFGSEPLPPDRRVFLQRRGWRTGLFGWTIGGLLGGSHYPGIEVTPTTQADSASGSSDLAPTELAAIKSDIDRLVPTSVTDQLHYTHQQTLVVHIPVSSGDGYFRLLITSSPSPLSVAGIPSLIAASPSFRIGSLSLSSAHPRGSTPLGLIPELLVRSLFIAGRGAAFALFYAAFPFLKVATWMPGPVKQWAMRVLYQSAGGEERFGLKERVEGMNLRLKRANDKLYKTVPFGAVGVRTAADMLKDEELGRQGLFLEPGIVRSAT